MATWSQREHPRPCPPVLPKGTALSHYTQKELDKFAYLLNIRLRKRFNLEVSTPCNRPLSAERSVNECRHAVRWELLFAITLLCVIELMSAACFKTRSRDIGLTTEIALLLVLMLAGCAHTPLPWPLPSASSCPCCSHIAKACIVLSARSCPSTRFVMA